MVVRKSGSRWAVKHCHGAKAGKTIATFKTKTAAMKMHRAIQANKKNK